MVKLPCSVDQASTKLRVSDVRMVPMDSAKKMPIHVSLLSDSASDDHHAKNQSLATQRRTTIPTISNTQTTTAKHTSLPTLTQREEDQNEQGNVQAAHRAEVALRVTGQS